MITVIQHSVLGGLPLTLRLATICCLCTALALGYTRFFSDGIGESVFYDAVFLISVLGFVGCLVAVLGQHLNRIGRDVLDENRSRVE